MNKGTKDWSDMVREGKPHRKVDLELRFEVTDWLERRETGSRESRGMERCGFVLGGGGVGS